MPTKHSPTPWRVGTIDLSDEAGTSAAIFDANGVEVLQSPEVFELGGAPLNADAADAVHAVEAVNRMAKMDEAAMIQSIAEAARPLPRGAGFAALDRAMAMLSGDGDMGLSGICRRALEIVVRTAHGATCGASIGKSCSCHVGVAERALMAAEHVAKDRSAEKPSEHVAVVRPDQPGTVNFVPPLLDRHGFVLDHLDVRNNADGSIGLHVAYLRGADPEGRPTYEIMGERPAIRVDPKLVERYRKARVASYAMLGPRGDARGHRSEDVDRALHEWNESCVELANAVLEAAKGQRTESVVADLCPKCGSTNYGPDDMGFMSCRDCGFTGPELPSSSGPFIAGSKTPDGAIRIKTETPTMPHDREQPYPEFPVDPNKPKEPNP